MSADSAERVGDWIQTFTGIRFWPFDPRPEEIDIIDIAHALSMQCRFTGHARQFYSVAQHSIEVSLCCDSHGLWGLLHDASEAYLCDVARPVKRHPGFAVYRQGEELVMKAVCLRFGLPWPMPEIVHKADELLLATEARDFLSPLLPGWLHVPENGYEVLPRPLSGVSHLAAEAAFLNRFWSLQRKEKQ